MKTGNCFLFMAFMFGISISSCSQNSSSATDIPIEVFAGSTPCNPVVNRSLNIPSTDTCVYMKWELDLYRGQDTSHQFKLMISYGDYLPNTMFFLGGGKNISQTGKLSKSSITKNNTPYTILHLKSDKNHPELLFIKMTQSILHLIDSDLNFIKGDASHAFILNRIDSLQRN